MNKQKEHKVQKRGREGERKTMGKRRDFLKYISKRAINNNMVILSMPMGFLYFIGPVCIWFWFENEEKKNDFEIEK